MRMKLDDKKPTTFGQKRSQDLEARYKAANDQRKKLIRAQFAAGDPLQSLYKKKVDMISGQISRLKPRNNS